jgi:hypothetical protein
VRQSSGFDLWVKWLAISAPPLVALAETSIGDELADCHLHSVAGAAMNVFGQKQ